MAFSLNLPFWVCYRATKLARRWKRIEPMDQNGYDPETYFGYQYNSTKQLAKQHFQGLDFKKKVVLDVGSGLGGRAPYFLALGAERVICIDINRQELELGRKLVAKKFPEVAAKIEFVHPEDFKESETGDLAISFDSFEHVMDPAKVLRDCRSWLRAGGKLWVSSLGWYNYMASHCRWHIPIPWCQVLFSEKAIIRTIQTLIREPDYVPNMWERAEGVGRWDNVTTLKYRPGEPMNMLSLRQVKRLMKQSGFRVEFTVHGFSGRANPLARGLAFLSKVPVLNEIFHSSYSAVLTKAESDRPIGSLSRAA